MPHTARKQGNRYAIVKKLPGGHTKTVGHSSTKAKAKASARARDAGAHGWKPKRK